MYSSRSPFSPKAPYVIKGNLRDGNTYELSGYALVFWDLLQALANFT
jgi:hypothetical protein